MAQRQIQPWDTICKITDMKLLKKKYSSIMKPISKMVYKTKQSTTDTLTEVNSLKASDPLK